MPRNYIFLSFSSASSKWFNWAKDCFSHARSFCFSGCKHLRLGLLLANEMGVDINSERNLLAERLVDQEAYFFEDSKIIVNGDAWSGIYDLRAHKCSCVAFSQGFKCVCSVIAEMQKVTIDTPESPENKSPEGKSDENFGLSIQQKQGPTLRIFSTSPVGLVLKKNY